jgi:hypothetical protein
LEKLRSHFFFDYRAKIQSIWFKRLLYVYLIIRALFWLAHFDLLFGENSIVFSNARSIGLVKDLAFLLYSNSNVWLSLVFLLALFVLSFASLFGKGFYFFCDLLIWFIVINIHNKLYPSLTGGDLLLNQFLVFNCVVSQSEIKTDSKFNEIKILLHNLAVLSIMFQLSLVYFLSGLAKIGDTEWLEGRAIMAVAQIRHFSLSNFLVYTSVLDPLYIFLNYLVVAYQVLFPILVWFKPIKKPLLLIGLGMHLYIGLVMGLPEFGLIMIIAYVYFWPIKARFE